jgi:hypothetical protein
MPPYQYCHVLVGEWSNVGMRGCVAVVVELLPFAFTPLAPSEIFSFKLRGSYKLYIENQTK